MKPQHLIQAFSRTNRLFDKTKRFGQIVTMQTPAIYARLIDEALVLYSNGGTKDVAAPSWDETKEKFANALASLKEVVRTPADAKNLNSKEEMQAFVKAFQALDRSLGELQVYDQFREEELSSTFGFDREAFDDFMGVYKNTVEKLRSMMGGDDREIIDIDVEYQLESVKTVEVNYRYLIVLIQAHMPSDDEDGKVLTEADDKRISSYIERFKKENLAVGEILDQMLADA